MGGLNVGWLGLAPKSWNKKASEFLTGTPGKRENVSTLRPEQEQLYEQLINSGMNPGAGGAFGQSADYYRNLLSNENEDISSFMAPEMRRFNEQIVPDLAEQFATMGSGGLSSSGFRNSATSAGADLSERLGALRAQLRQQGAQGLAQMGQQGLQPFSQNMETRAPTPGFLSSIAPAVGAGLTAFGGGAGSALAGGLAGGLGNAFNRSNSAPQQNPNMVGQGTSPYGGGGFSSQLPNFNPRARF